MDHFEPLPASYGEQWRRHGYVPPAPEDETCNRAEFSCPLCRASDRERLYALWLRGVLPRTAPSFRFVDFAPAPALSTHLRRRYAIHYRTADLFMPDVDDRVDLRAMPGYASGSIDAFLCSHVLEHIDDDVRAMAELFRILRPGGWGIAMVPIPLGVAAAREGLPAATEAERWRNYGQGDHVRIYSRPTFVSRLESVGFQVRAIPASEVVGTSPARFGISATSVLYVAGKPTLRP